MGYNILVLQQAEGCRPGPLVYQAAKEHNVHLQVTRVWQESAADFAEFDGLLILGGPYRLEQDSQYPFLREEKRLIRAWMNLNRPCLGFNLGHHLIAEAAGATIGPAHSRFAGLLEGFLTHEGRAHPLFQGVQSPFTLFKWHSQEIQSPLPRTMVLLATSKECMVEACCLEGRPHIVGLQCDNYAGIPEGVLHGPQRCGQGAGSCDRCPDMQLLKQDPGVATEMTTTFSLLLRNFIALTRR
jgi:GMP synthase-like glutamine amidotransferase